MRNLRLFSGLQILSNESGKIFLKAADFALVKSLSNQRILPILTSDSLYQTQQRWSYQTRELTDVSIVVHRFGTAQHSPDPNGRPPRFDRRPADKLPYRPH